MVNLLDVLKHLEHEYQCDLSWSQDRLRDAKIEAKLELVQDLVAYLSGRKTLPVEGDEG